jgi:O-acetylserine/cysteine efflux transporter
MSEASVIPRGDHLRALGVIIIWGLNFVVMKLGLQGLSPTVAGLALRTKCLAIAYHARDQGKACWR